MESPNSTSDSRKTSRHGKSKLFQCSGHGDCRMVFTRSEHLARHMRKHTGEKPFKCIVPGCDRMFSRFDNMMQHTQTHNKSRASRRTKSSSSGNGNSSRSKSQTPHDKDRPDFSDKEMTPNYRQGVADLPSPPPSRRGSMQADYSRKRRSRADESDDEEERDDEDEDSDASYKPPKHKRQHSTKSQRVMMAELRRLSREEGNAEFAYRGYPAPFPYHYPQAYVNPAYPPPTHPLEGSRLPPLPPPPMYHQDYPTSPRSFGSCSSNDDHVQQRSRRITPKVYFYYPNQRRRHSENFLAGRMILPRIANYLVNHPGEPPENYLLHYQREEMASSPHHKFAPARHSVTRRLSVQELCNPIHYLNQPRCASSESESEQSGQGVDLTLDEFEALQGLGRLQQ